MASDQDRTSSAMVRLREMAAGVEAERDVEVQHLLLDNLWEQTLRFIAEDQVDSKGAAMLALGAFAHVPERWYS